MPEQEPSDIEETPSKTEIRNRRSAGRRVFLDASTPTFRSILRVVVITLLLLLVAGYLQTIISSLANLFFLIVLSVFFAYLIDPIVKVIRHPFKAYGIERFMPRSLAIILSYIFVFTILAVVIANVAPRVGEQAREFGANLPSYAQAFRERTNELNRRFDRLRVPDEVQAEFNKKISDMGTEITASVGGFVLMSVTYLPWLILVPILAFFFLKDVNQFRLMVLRMFPAGRLRYRTELILADVNTTLAAYTRAQLISCFVIAILCIAGFYILGLKYALMLGILAGIFEFVPLLGPAAIGVIVILVAAATDSPQKALYAAIFLIVLRIVHDYVTYPRIVRGGIHLHPLAIILSVLAGEQVAGIPGVFISIPIVAVATVIYKHVLEHRGTRGILTEVIVDVETVPAEVD